MPLKIRQTHRLSQHDPPLSQTGADERQQRAHDPRTPLSWPLVEVIGQLLECVP